MKKPELVAPAGNLEKLKVAIHYGADAVYMSGEDYGLRASADNFSAAEIEEGVAFAHARERRAYVTLNALMHDEDLKGLKSYCGFLEELGVDGVIVSDAGVAEVVRAACSIPLHLSTQASCLNSYAAKAWRARNVQRIVVGRELSIAEASEIQKASGVEVEMFVHGSMCMAVSGRCAISNYLANRDANRGGCIQACRFGYLQGLRKGKHKDEDDGGLSHFMSSKDLLGLFQIPNFIEKGITALKLEGRMKSALYVAVVTSAYRRAIDAYQAGSWNQTLIEELLSILDCAPHRDFTEASLLNPAGADSIYRDNASTAQNASHDIVGIVIESDASQLLLKNYQSIRKGGYIEFIGFKGEKIPMRIAVLRNALGEEVEKVRQESIAMLEAHAGIHPFQLAISPVKKGTSRFPITEEAVNVG